jgi:glycosyltransferase involved in cell wall biosynthesis
MTESGMRVLVFEPQFAGHNLSYAMHLMAKLIALECDVHLVTSAQATRSEEFDIHLSSLKGKYQCHAVDGFVERAGMRGISVNGPAGNYSMMQGLLKGLREVQPKHLFVPFGNPIAHLAGLPNPLSNELRRQAIESELVLLFGKYAYEHNGWRSRCKEWMALAVLARGPWTRIHHIVPHATRVMKAYSPAMRDKCRLLPDPVEPVPDMNKMEARRCLNIDEHGRNIALVGLIERRKGVFELLESFRKALPNLRPNDRIVLAGKSTGEVREALASRFSELVSAGRIVSIDRHLSANELWAACIGADLVCTPYPNHRYSASIVIRAAAAGVPLLANSIGWMNETINRFSLGTTCDTNNEQVFADQILKALNASSNFRLGELGKGFVEFHSSENFAAHLTQRISQRIGRESEASLIDWECISPPIPSCSTTRAA